MNEEGGVSGITPSSLKKGKYRRRNLSGLNLCLPIQISINIYKIINRDGLQSFHIWLFVLFSHKIITDLILSLKYGVLIDSGKERDLDHTPVAQFTSKGQSRVNSNHTLSSSN